LTLSGTDPTGIILEPFGAGTKSIQFKEATANGTNFVALKGPSALAGNITFTLPAADASVANQAMVSNGAGVLSFATLGGGSGDVVGPESSTNNSLARFDGTTGKLIKSSFVTVTDSGKMYLGARPIVTSGFTLTEPLEAVVRTTQETDIIGRGVGTLSIGANVMVVGSTSTARMFGVFDCKNGDDLTFRIYSGASLVQTVNLQDLPSVPAATPWELECVFFVRSVGKDGEYLIQNKFMFQVSAGSSPIYMSNNTVRIDTTVRNDFRATIQLGAARSDLSLACLGCLTTNFFQP
jgi:hypothetical protein